MAACVHACVRAWARPCESAHYVHAGVRTCVSTCAYVYSCLHAVLSCLVQSPKISLCLCACVFDYVDVHEYSFRNRKTKKEEENQ